MTILNLQNTHFPATIDKTVTMSYKSDDLLCDPSFLGFCGIYNIISFRDLKSIKKLIKIKKILLLVRISKLMKNAHMKKRYDAQ